MIPEEARDGLPCFWANPVKSSTFVEGEIGISDIKGASELLERFAPYIAQRFPETAAQGGIIESPLLDIPRMSEALASDGGQLEGRLMLKMDSELPIAGSVKARGGIYEVLKHSEILAMKAGLISRDDDYRWFSSSQAHCLFSEHTIQVGSTGNLGLSIGIMASALGYHVIVHMSHDARRWKKDLLLSHGVEVIEYSGDYSAAVDEGRRRSEADPKSHFVDDERSLDLFCGYATAAERLRRQFDDRGIVVDDTHPLLVYLPCGIGGAPGGISYGLGEIFGSSLHCFFVEPTEACCMLVGLASELDDGISVQDIGLSGSTASDGLAVARPSGLVCELVRHNVDGVFTLTDDEMFSYERQLHESEGLFVEPSAATGFCGPRAIGTSCSAWAHEHVHHLENATHIVWSTGGALVPDEERRADLSRS